MEESESIYFNETDIKGFLNVIMLLCCPNQNLDESSADSESKPLISSMPSDEKKET